jgi:hypothetical protein
MARGNFNSPTKRSRELAKKDKRAVKDERRAQKKPTRAHRQWRRLRLRLGDRGCAR